MVELNGHNRRPPCHIFGINALVPIVLPGAWCVSTALLNTIDSRCH